MEGYFRGRSLLHTDKGSMACWRSRSAASQKPGSTAAYFLEFPQTRVELHAAQIVVQQHPRIIIFGSLIPRQRAGLQRSTNHVLLSDRYRDYRPSYASLRLNATSVPKLTLQKPK